MRTDWGPDIFVIDKGSSVPIYAQIVDRVEALVMSGKIKAGDRLPSIRSVAEATRVDYNTVAKAYAELDRAGVIKTARGVGTHVTGAMDEETLRASRQAKLYDVLEGTIRDLMELGYGEQEIREAFSAVLRA
ncbi:MAG: GntR family transcriptional regulator [Anaerolineae bacterium]|nr:GntR family transcriptional regulator [Anaerolineae bacterium]